MEIITDMYRGLRQN